MSTAPSQKNSNPCVGIGAIPSPPASLTATAKKHFEVAEEAAEKQSTASTVLLELKDVDPYNLSTQKKWIITWVSSFFTFLVACCTTSYTMGYPSMTKDLGCTTPEAVLGLSVYIIAFAVTPLFTAAFSEEVGRQPLYYVSIAVFALMHVMVALAPNIEVVIVARLIQGAAGSTGATMVAGTLSDIWDSKDRGLPMGLYSMGSFVGNAFGTVFSGWVEQNTKLQWKWIQWISLMIAGTYFAIFVLTMQETRASVLYTRQAKKILSAGQALDVPPPSRPPLKELLWVSCTRPLVLLFTEVIVLSITVWVGFAWAMLYCLIGSIPPVFRTLHDFTTGEVGTVYVTMIIGSFIGYATTLYQERIYLTKVRKHGVEARLYMCCLAGIAFPASMFMFAWLCFRQIHWALLCFSLTLHCRLLHHIRILRHRWTKFAQKCSRRSISPLRPSRGRQTGIQLVEYHLGMHRSCSCANPLRTAYFGTEDTSSEREMHSRLNLATEVELRWYHRSHDQRKIQTLVL